MTLSCLRHVFLCLVSALLVAGTAMAQDDASSSVFKSISDRAAKVIDEGDARIETYEGLRRLLVEYRDRYDAQRLGNKDRIAALRTQIAVLAPPTDAAEAEAESEGIKQKRSELERELTALLAPIKVAEVSFFQADSQVRAIDDILRGRRTAALLSVSESPLKPALWAPAMSELWTAFNKLRTDPITPADGPKYQAQDLPLLIAFGLFGLLLVVRGRRWAGLLVDKLRQYGAKSLGVWRFLVSILRIVLPLAGLTLICLVITRSNLLGANSDELVILIPILGAIMLGFRWVSERVFSRDDDEALILLPGKDRASLRFWVNAITLLIVSVYFLEFVLEISKVSTVTKSVLTFPITIMMSIALWRFGKLMRSYYGSENREADAQPSTLARAVRGLGLASVLVAIAAPLLHAAGYYNASTSLQQPFVLSLALLGLVLALQRFLADVYGGLTGQGTNARDALWPIIFGMVLLLLSLPLLALIWGVQLNDLTEMWTAFMRGFAVGNTRISPTIFLTLAVVFVMGYMVTRLIQGALRSSVLPKTKIDLGGQNAIVSGLGYIGIFLAALIAITAAGIDLSSLAIVAGALSVGIGFGLQNIVSNFVSGIILLIERPISEGDWIEVGGQMGYVRDISVRSTRIETFDKTDVIVPNADLISGTVTNFTRGNTVGRVIVRVGVGYTSDTRLVETLLKEIAEAQPMVLATPPPSILLVNLGADALEFEMRLYLRDVNWTMSVKNDVNHQIIAKFRDAGIEIPFAQRDLWLRNPETLHDEGNK